MPQSLLWYDCVLKQEIDVIYEFKMFFLPMFDDLADHGAGASTCMYQ